ncbi:hypothetical protein A136_13995 [Vibrio crassostreae 9ZC13]|uniref:oligosaccharide repeat unit polymerase n=1 Tax=Vibrio crassostreae TaxID=246167 RepID=UPI0002EDFF2B|nr:oligosaccharide repeat unit polymerase [Vibrio crassostreae]OEF00506.1 hypothetical protein A136_13995 [Vibrio crassostreae 9ZC13]
MIFLFGFLFISILAYRVYRDWNDSLLITPVSGLALVSFLLLMLPPMLNSDIVISPISVVGLVTVSFFCLYIPSSFKRRFRLIHLKNIKIIEFVFFLLFVVHVFITFKWSFDIIKVHGFLGAFFRNRLDDYLNSNIGSGAVLGTLHLLTQFVFYFYVGQLLSVKNNKIKKIGLAVVILYVFCVAVYANTRLSVVIPVVVFLSFYCYSKGLKFKRIAFISLIFFTVLPTYLVLANNLRHGIDDEKVDVNVTKIIAEQLDYNKYINELYLFYDDYQKMEYGSGWLLASFGNVIPRFIWEGKPVTSFSNRLTVDITGKELSLWNPVRTYTIFGTGYTQLYFLGVVLETIFYIFLFSRLFYSFKSLNGGEFFSFYIACLSLIYFRGETPFIQIMLIYLTYLYAGYSKKTS